MAKDAGSVRKVAKAGAPLRYRRIVAKFGTNVLTAGGDRLDGAVMAGLVGQVACLRERGAEVIVVTSGAIAAGRHRLGGGRDRKDMPYRQGGPATRPGH